MQDHLVDQAAQEGLSLLLREQIMVPEGRKMLANRFERRLKLLRSKPATGHGLCAVGLSFFSLFECGEGFVPSLLQGCGDQTIVRVNAQKLSLGKLSLIPQTLQVLRVGMSNLVDGFLLWKPRRDCRHPAQWERAPGKTPPRYEDQRYRRGYVGRRAPDISDGENCRDSGCRPCIARPSCAHTPHSEPAHAAALSLSAALLAFCYGRIQRSYPGASLESAQTSPRKCRLDRYHSHGSSILPAEAGSVSRAERMLFAQGACSPVDKGTSVGRILQDLQDGGSCWFLPNHISKTISSR